MTVGETQHEHMFLAVGHESNERRTWAVIALCGVMMAAEIIGGAVFGSVALIADGLHMSTHAGALLIAAAAYTYARRHATDRRFAFGTGKLGDLAGFTSAIILAMIAMLIGYEAIGRLFAPIPIDFAEAIPIAILGLAVNVASAWLLSGGHHHGHGHDHGHEAPERHPLDTIDGPMWLEVFEDGVPPRFRLHREGQTSSAENASIETLRPDGSRQVFALIDRGGYLESTDAIPEPHEFAARLRLVRDGRSDDHEVMFAEHDHDHAHGKLHRDNNLRSAFVHVIADAAVSVLVIVGLILGRLFNWLWVDPLVGVIGAFVIANWAYGLIGDTGAILLDMTADGSLAERLRKTIETNGDSVADLHLWRLGPGHLGAILSVATNRAREPAYYRERLRGFSCLSHLTIEVRRR